MSVRSKDAELSAVAFVQTQLLWMVGIGDHEMNFVNILVRVLEYGCQPWNLTDGPQRPGCTGGTGGQPKLPKNPPQPRTKAQINYIAKNERRSKEGFTFLASRDAQEVVLVILLADHFHSLLKDPFTSCTATPWIMRRHQEMRDDEKD